MGGPRDSWAARSSREAKQTTQAQPQPRAAQQPARFADPLAYTLNPGTPSHFPSFPGGCDASGLSVSPWLAHLHCSATPPHSTPPPSLNIKFKFQSLRPRDTHSPDYFVPMTLSLKREVFNCREAPRSARAHPSAKPCSPRGPLSSSVRPPPFGGTLPQCGAANVSMCPSPSGRHPTLLCSSHAVRPHLSEWLHPSL